jgi:hypothetical protein
MPLIDKEYFTLEEIEERWGLPRRDLVYMYENGLIKLSIRLFGVWLEFGHYEELGGGHWGRMPVDRSYFNGFQDLGEHDVFRLFRDGTVEVSRFPAPERGYCYVVEPSKAIAVRQVDVIIRREERDRAEGQYDIGPKAGHPAFSPADFITENGQVRLGDRVYHLGPVQAQIVTILRRAAETDNPWCVGKSVLREAGSGCTRLSDIFKSQPLWRELIESDGKGRYRLRVPPTH